MAEVVRAVKALCDGIGIGVGAEIAALNDGLYGLVDVREVELEGTCDDDGWLCVGGGWVGEIYKMAIVGTSQCIGVGRGMGGDVGEEHSPGLLLDVVDVGEGACGVVEEDALVGVVVDGAGFLQELAEGHGAEVEGGELGVGAQVVDLQETLYAWDVGKSDWVVGVDDVGEGGDVDAG